MEINNQNVANTAIIISNGNIPIAIAEPINDQVTLHTSITVEDSEHCIFKVHNQLRNVNHKAYDPEVIAIGPYHRGKSDNLKLMEAHKLRFQKLMLHRKNEELSTYLDAIMPLGEAARKCYSEPTTDLSLDEFVSMLVLDGIFIIELLWKFKKFVLDRKTCGPIDFESNNIRNDPLFKMPWALNLLQRDLMLFENQLPFFILVKLFEMIEPPDTAGPEGIEEFNSLALFFFNDLFPGHGEKRESTNTTIDVDQDKNIKHFLDLIHMYWGSKKLTENGSCSMDNLELMGCSTRLREAGIKLKKIKDGVSFDIEFKKGELRIPVLTVEGRTESLLRNLIAYEQYCGDSRFHIVTDYMIFFSCLIKSEEDVARLTRHGILHSFISDDKVTTQMFGTMNDCITGPSENFQYGELFKRVNAHCKWPFNKYMAILRRDYVNSPWGIISVLTLSALLLLAVLEVAFQILSWKQQ